MGTQGLQVLREQTRHHIEDNPLDLILIRRARVDDGAGGTTVTTSSVTEQKFRLIARDTVAGAQERRTVDGVTVVPQYVLLGEWDANVQVGDRFTITDPNKFYEVVFVRLDRRYATTAEVAYRG